MQNIKKRRCTNCHNIVRKSRLEWYDYECGYCDEDLNLIETYETEKDLVSEIK